MSDKKDINISHSTRTIDQLYNSAVTHIDAARQSVQRTINIQMIKAYWLIGQDIVLNEQSGEERAEYGKSVLKLLSNKLQQKYKRGFGIDTLEQARKFYIIYQEVAEEGKSDAARRKLEPPSFNGNLSWTHYRALMRVKRSDARSFYEKEATQNCWSSRELERQIGSLLFERLSRTKNQQEILKLSQEGQEIDNPEDAIKEPLILEFLGLPESHKLIESKVEDALITNLQKFLLELGKGFSFIARQKRLSLDNDHYYADLVFYHVILKCYVIIDIKTHRLEHADLGQMQLYVNYFDMEVKRPDDNPTIGLVLCTEKRDEMAKYMLGEKGKQIFASTYQFHLPTEEELAKELKREIKEIKHELGEKSDEESEENK